MGDIDFQWDKRIAALNEKKHGIGFSEAVTVFYDDYVTVIEMRSKSFELYQRERRREEKLSNIKGY